jgi:hypothetical protein
MFPFGFSLNPGRNYVYPSTDTDVNRFPLPVFFLDGNLAANERVLLNQYAVVINRFIHVL